MNRRLWGSARIGDALHLLPIVTRRSALLVLLTLSQIVTGLHVHVTPDPKPRIRLSQEILSLFRRELGRNARGVDCLQSPVFSEVIDQVLLVEAGPIADDHQTVLVKDEVSILDFDSLRVESFGFDQEVGSVPRRIGWGSANDPADAADLIHFLFACGSQPADIQEVTNVLKLSSPQPAVSTSIEEYFFSTRSPGERGHVLVQFE